MNEKAIEELYRDIASLLANMQLREAQEQLQALLRECGDWALDNRLEQARTAYAYMLQYMRQGVDDPGRARLHKRLLAETHEIADQARLKLLDGASTRFYHLLRKQSARLIPERSLARLQAVLEAFPDEMAICLLLPEGQGADKVMKRHEDALQSLFLTVWTDSAWTGGEEEEATRLVQSALTPVPDRCLLVSAVTLSLLQCFDPRKYAWLLQACACPEEQLRQRALVGVLLATGTHRTRLPLYPDLEARLSLMGEEEAFGNGLARAYAALQRSCYTEEVDRQMREEIIPDMMRNVDLLRHFRPGGTGDDDEAERNPDWGEALEQAGLGDKIRLMHELQAEGEDIYMATFAQLKKFAFFHDLCNWFYPFEMRHSAVVRLLGLQPTGENASTALLLKYGFFCDSDKYSLCFVLNALPVDERRMALSQMAAQDMEAMEEERRREGMPPREERPEDILRQYVQDLYRFYRLSPRKEEFTNPLVPGDPLHEIPALAPLLRTPERLRPLADYHFRKRHWREAFALYSRIASLAATDDDVCRKAAYCQQKQGNPAGAISLYLKAEVLKPNHAWTLRQLATCHRRLGQHAEALRYYEELEAMNPDDPTLLYPKGSCLAELKAYDDALHCFFKLDYLEERCTKAWRAIAWCSFLTGKEEQARKYYGMVIEESPVASDYLNLGHLYWCHGDLAQASQCYRQCLRLAGGRHAFREMLLADREILAERGIPEEELALMADMVE